MIVIAPDLVNSISSNLGLAPDTVTYFVWPLIQIILVVNVVAFYALYATYAERKIAAFMQARLGPMRVGPYGLLQPIADAIKLLTKEDLVPGTADKHIFRLVPYLSVGAAFTVLVVIPFAPQWGVITDINIALLFVLGVSSLGAIALVLAGWSSNSKYSLMGGLRSAAQMVSYEVAMGLSLIGILLFSRTLSLSGIVAAQNQLAIPFVLFQPFAFVCFLISGIAENNRAPFDLPEAESELVAGYHTEYSGMRWSLFFMAEYTAMVVMCALATSVFLGGWWFPFVHWLTVSTLQSQALYILVSLLIFAGKMALLLYLYFWTRWSFPRYRFDQLMDLGWRWLIPGALVNIAWTSFALFLILALDGWHGHLTVAGAGSDFHFTGLGSALMIVAGVAGLGLIGATLYAINRNSRDFNLKLQRRELAFVQVSARVKAAAEQ